MHTLRDDRVRGRGVEGGAFLRLITKHARQRTGKKVEGKQKNAYKRTPKGKRGRKE